MKKIKIAVLFSNGSNAGGAHTAEKVYYEQICEALKPTNKLIKVYIHKNKFLLCNSIDKIDSTKRRYFINKFKEYILTLDLVNIIVSVINIRPFSKFEKILKRNNVDLIISLSVNPILNSLREIPYFVFVWDLGHRDLPEIQEISHHGLFEMREILLKKNILKSSAVFSESIVGSKKIENFYGKSRSQIVSLPFIPLHLNESKIENYDRKIQEKYVFYPAHFWTHKNHRVLLEALAITKKNTPQYRSLLLSGEDRGNLKQIKEIIAKLELKDDVHILGFLHVEDLWGIFSNTDYLAMPSILGPTNFPPLEALIRGIPVAVSDVSGFDYRLKKYMNELDPHNVLDWSGLFKLEQQIQNPPQDEIFEIFQKIREENINSLSKEISKTESRLLLRS